MRLGTDPPLHDGEHEQGYQFDLKQKKVLEKLLICIYVNDQYQHIDQVDENAEEYFGLKGALEVVVEEGVEELEVVLVN